MKKNRIKQIVSSPLTLREGMGVGLLFVMILFISCARMGSPDGGWYDDKPPRIVSTSPQERSINVTDRKITITFNEYVKIEDATNKVIVSPPQLEAPEIKSAGKKIVVELLEQSLLALVKHRSGITC